MPRGERRVTQPMARDAAISPGELRSGRGDSGSSTSDPSALGVERDRVRGCQFSAAIAHRGAFQLEEAAQYLGMSASWLEEAGMIPRCDIRKPGAKRPTWVWRKADLDAFLESRLIQPGQRSPFGVEGQ